jgi:NADPH:quinone reductase-like Zn-dependent oxidoreductase
MEDTILPKTYNAIELEIYGGPLKIKEKTFRDLEEEELLVKVMCATIHPADLFMIKGAYGTCTPEFLPMVPGFEGSGIIVKVGSKLDSKLIGKKCNLFGGPNKNGNYEGLWTQYQYTSLFQTTVFNSDVSFDQICFATVNPLTACGFIDTLKKQNVKVVGQNGASSAFAKMFIRLCAKEGIKTVNVVRKQEHIKKLKEFGADVVLNSCEGNWENEFKSSCESLNVKHFFECVGGSMTGKILNLLPNGSTVYHYGNLELKDISDVKTADLIFQKKTLTGWWLSDWIKTLSLDEIIYWKSFVVKEYESGSDLFETVVSKSYALEEFEKAFESYLGNMSAGKVLFKPNN